MIRALAVLLLASLPAAAQITKTSVPAGAPPPAIGSVTPSKVPLATLLTVERDFNQKLSTLFEPNEQLDLLGLTRGVYLEGYGVVFTTELSLVRTPAKNPFMQSIPKAIADRVRQRKIDRLPVLKTAMKDLLANAARTLSQLPPEQQVVVAVRFLYESWEDRNGMPSQILMRADRKSAMAGAIQLEEQ
jgi:hypothetical protein